MTWKYASSLALPYIRVPRAKQLKENSNLTTIFFLIETQTVQRSGSTPSSFISGIATLHSDPLAQRVVNYKVNRCYGKIA